MATSGITILPSLLLVPNARVSSKSAYSPRQRCREPLPYLLVNRVKKGNERHEEMKQKNELASGAWAMAARMQKAVTKAGDFR